MSDTPVPDSDQAAERPSLRCSFCLENSSDVGSLLKGPWRGEASAAYICRACVERCALTFDAQEEEMAVIGESEDSYFGEFIEDEAAESPINAATQEMLKEKIDQVLKTLTHREREIIKLRYGLGDGYTYTVEEIAQVFNVTRERVREIEARAVTKLAKQRRALEERDERPAWHPKLFVEPDPPPP
jgi:RNA polymerase sigma factor (sigma-70 family)